MKPWFSRGRPPEQKTLTIAVLLCRCGRKLYMTLRERDWGQAFCRGCDEDTRRCYCPRVPEEATA